MTDTLTTREINFSIDGYGVGDRMLEGVMFRIEATVTSDHNDHMLSYEIVSCEVEEQYADYFSKFNQEYWYKLLKNRANDTLNDLLTFANNPNEYENENGIILPYVWQSVLFDKNKDNTLEM